MRLFMACTSEISVIKMSRLINLSQKVFFSTLDNIDFIDTEKVSKMIYKANDVKNILRDALHRFHLEKNDAEFCECPTGEMHWEPAGNYDALLLQAKNIHLLEEKNTSRRIRFTKATSSFQFEGTRGLRTSCFKP
jgi:hypothetical protein